jgi:hypothetical protein
LLPTLRSLVASLAQFLESRVQLAARESKAAARHLLMLVAFCLAGRDPIDFRLRLLGRFPHFCDRAFFRNPLDVGALGAALLHFLVAVCFLIVARQQVKHPILRDTANVLKEDTKWLKNLDQTKPQ